MAVPTMEELKTLRAAVSALEDKANLALEHRKFSVENAIAYDLAHAQYWQANSNYTHKLNEFIEAGKVEGVRV